MHEINFIHNERFRLFLSYGCLAPLLSTRVRVKESVESRQEATVKSMMQSVTKTHDKRPSWRTRARVQTQHDRACLLTDSDSRPPFLHTDSTLLSDALAEHGRHMVNPWGYHDDQTGHIFLYSLALSLSVSEASAISHPSPCLQRHPSPPSLPLLRHNLCNDLFLLLFFVCCFYMFCYFL